MKNFSTWRQTDFAQMGMAGITENDVPRLTRQRICNSIVMKLFAVMDGENDPFYNFTAPLTVAADQEQLKDASTNGGVITAISAITNTVTRNAGVFVAGSIIEVMIWTKATSLIAFQWTARITVGGSTGTWVAISGTPGTFAGADHGVAVHVKKTLSVTTVDLSTLYLRKIVKVWDNGLTGAKDRVFYLTPDSRKFTEDYRNPDLEGEIRAYHRGDTLELAVGGSAAALATAQMEYEGKPNVYTDATENVEILIPPEWNYFLQDEMEFQYRKYGKKSVPDGLAERMAAYEKMFTAKLKDKARSEEAKGKLSE